MTRGSAGSTWPGRAATGSIAGREAPTLRGRCGPRRHRGRGAALGLRHRPHRRPRPTARRSPRPPSTPSSQTLESTAAGGCLLQLESAAAQPPRPLRASGGPGTYTMAFTTRVLDNQVRRPSGRAVRGLPRASPSRRRPGHGRAPTSSRRSTARSSSAVQQAVVSGHPRPCQAAHGSAHHRSPAAGRPARLDLATTRSATRRSTNGCWPWGAISPTQRRVRSTTLANQTAVHQADCVSQIVTDTQAHAQQLVAQLNAGASFADVAKASSLDSPDRGQRRLRWGATSPRPRSSRRSSCRA